MVKPIYWKSIAIGLAGILIIVALYFLSAYLADQEWQEHYRTSPGSGVLMVGVYPWILFFFDVLVAFAAIGALSAWASRRDIKSIRDTILASALAALVPIGLATALILLIFTVAFINTPENHRMSFFSSPFPLFLPYLAYAFVGLMMSVLGGVLYVTLAKALFHGKAQGPR